MGDNFANNFETTLTNGVDADDTAWTVGGSTDAPAVPFKCAMFNAGDVTEIITVTAASGTSWTVTRATEVTAGFSGGQSHSAGAVIKHVLTAGSLNQAVQGFIGAKAYNNAGQTIGGLDSPLLLNSEEFDTDGFHSTSSNTSRLTVPAGQAGKYHIVGGTYVTGGASGVYLRKNGSTRIRSARMTLANNEYGTVSAIVDLSVSDYVEIIGGDFSGRTFGDATDPNAMTSLALYKLSAPSIGSWGSGTAFPSGPSTNDRFTRTDLGVDFYWDGTRWLSTQVVHMSFNMRDGTTAPISAAGSFFGPPPVPITTSVWVVGFMFGTHVTTTNSGSHYWIITPSMGSAFNTSADGVATLKTHYVTVEASATTTDNWFFFSHTKNGSPGVLHVVATVAFRYIGT